MIADLTGINVITTRGAEFGALGAAITAMVSEKIYNSYDDAIKKL